MDFTFPIHHRRFVAVFRQPSMPIDIYSGQFSSEVWLWGAIINLLLLGAMALASEWEREIRPADSIAWIICKKIYTTERCEIDTLCIVHAGVITQQGSESKPLHFSTRLLFLSGFVFSMVCFASFGANIVTTLTTSKSIESVEELLASEAMNVTLTKVPVFAKDVEGSGHPTAAKVLTRAKEGIHNKCSDDTRVQLAQSSKRPYRCS